MVNVALVHLLGNVVPAVLFVDDVAACYSIGLR